MPSDAKKKQQQKKKDAAKARLTGKKPAQKNVEDVREDERSELPEENVETQNGTNGVTISAEGIFLYVRVKNGRIERNRKELKICVFGFPLIPFSDSKKVEYVFNALKRIGDGFRLLRN